MTLTRATVKALLLVITVIVIWIIWIALQVGSYSGLVYRGPADTAIILGAGVNGNVATPVFAERIDEGIRLYQEGRVHRLIFTGGVGAGDTLSEAEVGRARAIQAGIPPEAIVCEKISRTTFENLRNSRALVNPTERVLIITDPLHMRRAMMMARDAGLDAHPVPTRTSAFRSLKTQLPFWFNESRLYLSYLLRRAI